MINWKKNRSMVAGLMAMALMGAAMAPAMTVGVSAAQARTSTMIVNDSEIGNEPFTFAFNGGWVHEGGYPDRFEGGDEHWTTTAQFGSNYPSFAFRFVGSQVALYGHKVPAGAMADVTLDGKPAGRIDYYNASRIERTLLWQSDGLVYGEHTVTVQLIAEKNSAAGNTHEASIDYAVVTTAETLPATSVAASVESLLLEPGMSYPLSYTLLPAYATEKPTITYKSADESVATVTADGRVTAVAPGKTTVTLAPTAGDYHDTVAVTVREPVGGDLVAVAGSTNVHTRQDAYVTRLEKLDLSQNHLSVVAWQSDIATAKIDLLTKGKDMKGVTATVGTLTNEYGDVLNAAATVTPIRDTLAHDTSHLIPDVIGGANTIDLPAGSVGSLWMRLETPADALPGVYTGDVTVSAADGTTLALTLSVEIIGLLRPENTAALELWQYPYSANRYYSGKTTEAYFGSGAAGMWHTHLDERYTDALRSQLELYAAAGGRTVTVTIVEDPWNSQTPDPYPSMIKWTRERDGSMSFDYTDFDYWVALNESCGVDGGIMSFSMADWANQITYYDVRTDSVKTEKLTPGSDRWKRVWTEFLTDYMAHTTEKGWFDRVYMAMDERPAELVEQVLDVVESVRNEEGHCFRTALAVFSFETEHLFDRITDLSLAIYMTPEKVAALTEKRREQGLATTLYTCGAQYSALENPPYESLYGMWYCEKMGADGFLRWALDAFNDDPLSSSAHRLFAAGDIYLIYPDEKNAANPTARTSPRFEKLAEGCRDISKLRYISSLSDAHAAEVDAILEKLGRTNRLDKEVEQAQSAMASLSRRAAVERWMAAAMAEDVSDALTVALADAKALLSNADAADADLSAMACRLAKLMISAEETAPESDAPTEPASTVGISTEPATASMAEPSTAGATNAPVPDSGCASAVAPAALALTATGALILTVKRRHKDD